METKSKCAINSEEVIDALPLLEAQRAREKRTYRKISTAVFIGLLILLYCFPLRVFTGHDLVSHRSASRLTDLGLGTSVLTALGLKFTSDPTTAESLFIESPSEEILSKSLQDYTEHPHLAGSLALARYTRDRWLQAGIEDVEIVEYEVLLNYPTNRSQISLYEGGRKVWDATLREDVLEEDPGTVQAIPFFHGYSKNGSASGRLVYLNYGTPEDFATVSKHVDLKGKIGIARYGQLFRGLKVELAQLHGMTAVLLYDDPSEDHNLTVANGHEAYPHGRARNPSAVQRGSVQFLSVQPGDPSTPGYASIPGCDRQDPYKSIPSIPSIPINGRDAVYLLNTLNGHGPVPHGFAGAFPGIAYNIGDDVRSQLTVNLDNVVEYDYRPVYNVIAKIPGHFDDTIILGNHRDAWVRGASDPNSGSSALDSIVSTFGSLLRTGFVPLRTLIFASWDAEEYGLVGSTEWVEEHSPELSANVVAYLNVDVASSGINFEASSSPFLFDILRNTTESVPSVKGSDSAPGTAPIKTLKDDWDGKIKTLGSGSDYTAFQDVLGITSLDMGFKGGSSVYHYHSQYDSFHWLTKFGDPGLKSLQAATRLWGLLAYRLSESPVIPFNATTYGTELLRYIARVPTSSADSASPLYMPYTSADHKALLKLKSQATQIRAYGVDLDARSAHANAQVLRWPDLTDHERLALLSSIRGLNDEYRHFERSLLDSHGLEGRPFFKHILYAPGRWTGYAGAVFPSITEARSAEKRTEAIRRVHKILKRVGRV